MDKTHENITSNPSVALACWSGMVGIQIKGDVKYITEGEYFDSLVSWVKSENPDRATKGVLIISPEEVFDVGPTKSLTEEDLNFN